MATKVLAGVEVNVNDEGYMTDHSQWSREIGTELAKEVGIEMTEDHWKVIDFIQNDYTETGKVPTIRRVKKVGGIPTKELYALYPDGPIKKASLIAGYEKPASCI